MGNRTRVADFWDDVHERWRGDLEMADLPEPLHRWRQAYQGIVDLSGYPEGFLGDLRGEKREPRILVLGLNPGVAYPELTGPDGKWTRIIKDKTYSRCSEQRVPYGDEDWKRVQGQDNPFWRNLVMFARRWLNNHRAGVADILCFEMFPFHSPNLTHAIRPPRNLIESYVWQPLREMGENVVFAFGKGWLNVCAECGLSHIASYGKTGEDSYGKTRELLRDATNGNWQVEIYSLSKSPGKRIVVSWQQGYAGPPVQNIGELRRIVSETS